MNRSIRRLALVLLLAIALWVTLTQTHQPAAIVAQSPTVPPPTAPLPTAPLPTDPSLAAPLPTVLPTVSPTGSPAGPLPTPPFPAAPPPPTSTAPPLPLAEGPAQHYVDPAGRFKVGVLRGYQASPLAGSVLVEAPDGNLAYAVVAQLQPTGNPIGLVPTFLNVEALAQVATAVFQRGESFQPGPARAEAGGGVVLDWSGTLTIAGQSQPVGGTILIRPSSKYLLLLLVTATQAGSSQVPGAIAALANTLQPL